MITIGMNYRVIEGKEAPFETMFEKVIEAMQGVEGHGHTELYRSASTERSYLIVSDWETRKAFDDFITSDAFRKVTSWGLSGILAGPPKHTVYESSQKMGRPASTEARA